MPRFGNVKFGQKTISKGDMVNFVINDFREIGTIVKSLLEDEVERVKEDSKKKFVEAVTSTYEELKGQFETVTLQHEDDSSKNITKIIPTELITTIDELGATAEIRPINPEEGIILTGQHHGTGANINEELILKQFEVGNEMMVNEDGNSTDMSKWFFSGNFIDNFLKDKALKVFQNTLGDK